MRRSGTAAILALTTVATMGLIASGGRPCLAAGKIHLLAIGDTDDPKIGKSVTSDLGRITGIFYSGNVPEELFRPTSLKGADCRPDAILQAVDRLVVEPDDAVVVFFSGHGAYDTQVGEYFKFPRLGAGVFLKRSDLERSLRARAAGARLGVLLTDSCNRLSILPREPKFKAAAQAPMSAAPERLQIAALIRALFFDAAGFVNLASSKRGELSLCYPAERFPEGYEYHRGSLFTSAIGSTFHQHRDDVMGWKEFVEATAEVVRVEFQKLKPDGLDIEDEPEKPQMTQTVDYRGEVRAIRVTLRSPGGGGGMPFPPRPDPRYRSNASLGVHGFENQGRGIYVWSTRPESPAARLGLERGDVILAIDDATIRTARGYNEALSQTTGEVYLTFQDVRTAQVKSASVPLDSMMGRAPDDGRSQFGAAGVMAEGGGILVQSIVPGSPAALVGVDPGDVIRSINGAAIGSVEDYFRAVRDSEDEMWLTVRNVRNGQILGMVVPLDRPRQIFGRADYSLGINGFENQGRGLYVWSSYPGSPAAQLGFERGDVILSANGTPIDTVRTYQEALEGSGGRVELTFQDVRTGQVRSASARLDQPAPRPIAPTTSRFGAAGVEAQGGGILVQSIVPGSPAAQVGVDPGDVILTINGEVVATEPGYRRAVHVSPHEMRFEVRNIRNGQRLGMIARLDH